MEFLVNESQESKKIRLQDLISRIRRASTTNGAANDDPGNDKSEVERLVDTLSAIYGSEALDKALEMERESADKLYARAVRVALERRQQRANR